MVIGQTSQRVERRRRVLSDDRRAKASSTSTTSTGRKDAAGRTARRYTPAAAHDQQIRICDLIPRRNWTVLVWFLLSAIFVTSHASLEAVYHWALRQHLPIDLSVLSPGRSEQLSRFSLCMTALVAAAYATLVLNFRRHKIDDYRGRYRVWYSIVAALLLTTFLVGAGLTNTVKSAALWSIELSGLPMKPSWILAATVLLSIVVIGRIWLEIRGSRGAVTCLIGAVLTGCYVLAMQFSTVQPGSDALTSMLSSLALLSTGQLLLLSIVLYARFVFLDAQGLVVVRSRKSKKRPLSIETTKAKAGTTSAKKKRRPDPVDPDEDVTAPPLTVKRSTKDDRLAEADDSDASDEEDSDEEQPSTVKISRTDRRRQRKQKRRQQRAA